MYIVIHEDSFEKLELKQLVTQLVKNTSWVYESSNLELNFRWSTTEAEKDDLAVAITNERSKVVFVVNSLDFEEKSSNFLRCKKLTKLKHFFCCRM